MNKLLVAIALVVASHVAVLSQTAEEYKVYDAVIQNMFSGKSEGVDTGKLPELLVIREGLRSETTFKRFLDDGATSVNEITKIMDIQLDTYEDFRSNTKTGGRLSRSFAAGLMYVIVPNEKISSFFEGPSDGAQIENGWQAYYKEYPTSGGYISFSHVGFNKANDEAIVYFQHSCGSLCASGYYLVLNKQKTTWRVKNRRMLWIS